MKKLISIQVVIIAVLLMGVTNNASAQGEKAFEKGDVSLNMGMSFGLIGYNYGFYGNRSFPLPLTANLEYGINEYLGVGGYVGYLGISYGSSVDRYKFRNYSFGVQGVFHASSILNEVLRLDIDESKVDFYAKLLLGFETYSWKYDGNDVISNYYYSSSGSSAVFGPALGTRYLFNPNFGVYLEGGRGAFGWFTLGASIKF